MSATILGADDDGGIRTVLDQALGRLGYEVRSTGNAATLWKWVADGQGDLVITDVVMPGMGGRALAEHFLVLRPQGRVLYISGYMGDARDRRTLSIPDHQLLQKPFSADALTKKVAEVLLRQPAQSAGRGT